MLVNTAVQLAVLAAAALLWQSRTDAATTRSRLCGRDIPETMSKICKAYNKPSWDIPTVIEQPVNLARKKRDTGIADLCCNPPGCSFEQLYEYCSIPSSEYHIGSPLGHLIADRSAEKEPQVVAAPVVRGKRREVGRSLGYGRVRGRCWCRKRRSGRRRASLMGIQRRKKCSARCANIRNRLSPAHVGPNAKH